ncbi:hypothetical protein [Allomuricauda sp. M10]|uniref:hypothetical protein n=1 Tax=Allomuricauda sp. M10 TaxID=2683292 RepID=UPI001D18C43C|nr:hypothetical protein [Muricauda sp. M10]
MELDLLKEKWQKLDFVPQDKIAIDTTPSKSHTKLAFGTITKRLFIFSLIEFFLWGILGIGFQLYFKEYTPPSFLKFEPLIYLEKVNYVILGVFVTAFLVSFNTIRALDGVKDLIVNILKTKRIVNIYIYYNLVVFVITFLTSFIWELSYNEEIKSVLENKAAFVYLVIMVFGTAFTFAFTYLIYKVYFFTYGRFIIDFKKLAKNLKKLEDEIVQ